MLINGYSNLSVHTPDCHIGVPVWVANFKLDADVTYLFPYINAVVEDATYYENHDCIIFPLEDINCSLYPDRVNASPFKDRERAVEFIQRLIDFLNDLDTRKDSVTPNYKKYQPPVSVLEIFKLLPRTNCKKCNFATCMAFAAALSQGEAVPDQCPDLHNPENEISVKLKSMLA